MLLYDGPALLPAAQEIDYVSTCYTLVDCLKQLNDWSDDNPGHLPISVMIEVWAW
jgi:hypothetical protein